MQYLEGAKGRHNNDYLEFKSGQIKKIKGGRGNMEALPPEPTEPLTGRFMLGRLCKSLANCGVICL